MNGNNGEAPGVGGGGVGVGGISGGDFGDSGASTSGEAPGVGGGGVGVGGISGGGFEDSPATLSESFSIDTSAYSPPVEYDLPQPMSFEEAVDVLQGAYPQTATAEVELATPTPSLTFEQTVTRTVESIESFLKPGLSLQGAQAVSRAIDAVIQWSGINQFFGLIAKGVQTLTQVSTGTTLGTQVGRALYAPRMPAVNVMTPVSTPSVATTVTPSVQGKGISPAPYTGESYGGLGSIPSSPKPTTYLSTYYGRASESPANLRLSGSRDGGLLIFATSAKGQAEAGSLLKKEPSTGGGTKPISPEALPLGLALVALAGIALKGA